MRCSLRLTRSRRTLGVEGGPNPFQVVLVLRVPGIVDRSKEVFVTGPPPTDRSSLEERADRPQLLAEGSPPLFSC